METMRTYTPKTSADVVKADFNRQSHIYNAQANKTFRNTLPKYNHASQMKENAVLFQSLD